MKLYLRNSAEALTSSAFDVFQVERSSIENFTARSEDIKKLLLLRSSDGFFFLTALSAANEIPYASVVLVW